MANLRDGHFCAGAYVAKFGGSFTTLGGDDTETISVPGVLAGDIAIVKIKTEGATPRTCDRSATSLDTITVTMSGDPSTDHVLEYLVFRN